jgi:hypothetical protein
MPLQIVLFATAGLYSGIWWLRWARFGASAKMWPLLGWFSGLMCVGSVAGCVAWGASTQSTLLYYEIFEPGTRLQYYTLAASQQRWTTVFYIFNGLEFLCLIIPKLFLLGRLVNNAARSMHDEVPEMSGIRTSWRGGRALPMLYRMVASVVALCSAVGMAAYTAGSAYNSQISGLADQAAAACDYLGNDTNSSLVFIRALDEAVTHRYTCLAVQSVSEAVALLLISCAYLVLVTLSVSIFRQAEKVAAHALVSSPVAPGGQPQNSRATTVAMERAIVDDSMHAAAEQRRRLTLACVIVLVSFPCRAAFDLLQAYASYDVHYNSLCPSPCGTCQPTQYVVRAWLAYTPEFQPLVVALSSPLPMTVSLWLITAAHTRALAIHRNVQLAMKA